MYLNSNKCVLFVLLLVAQVPPLHGGAFKLKKLKDVKLYVGVDLKDIRFSVKMFCLFLGIQNISLFKWRHIQLSESLLGLSIVF